jgi:Zn-dependent M32 family carboxypeptidase
MMNIEYPKRGVKVTLKIPASRPIKTLNGVLHEAGQAYKVLGTHASLVRLSRVSDCAKLMVLPELLNY